MLALIDGDILRYELGCAKKENGDPLSWPLVKARLDGKIKSIAEKAGAESYVVYMSGKDNFRVEAATIRPYKGNRSSDKPYWHDKVEEYLKSGLNHLVVICDGYEADDGMSIAQWSDMQDSPCDSEEPKDLCDTIICSRDKDLHMCPGWHYSWASGNQQEKEPWFTTEDEGMRLFFLQLLTGDVTDNIPGLYMIGPVKAEKLLEGITEPLSMYAKVREQYKLRFGYYWHQFMRENGVLLWMLRTDPDVYGAHPEEQWEDLLESFDEQLEVMEEMAEVPDV